MTLTKLSNSRLPLFPSIFDHLTDRDYMDWTNTNFADSNSTLPAVNVCENENEFKIEVAVPGMSKKDFSINYENGRLTISSEHKHETSNKEEKYSRREFNYLSFQRSFSIPKDLVNGEKIEAKYTDGILLITLPKKEEAKPKPPKQIKIS